MAPATDSSSDAIRAQVATGCRILHAHGHGDYIWGHLSARDPDGRGFWMKPSGLGLEEVTADDVVLVDGDGRLLAGRRPRHSEWPIHDAILARRADVGAVIHTHPPHAVALAAAGRPLEAVSNFGTFFVPPGVPRFDATTALIRDRALAGQVADALGERDVLFLVNHGIVAVGAGVPAAVVRAVMLEDACRQQLLTDAFGGAATAAAGDEATGKGEVFSARIDALWAYFARRVDM